MIVTEFTLFVMYKTQEFCLRGGNHVHSSCNHRISLKLETARIGFRRLTQTIVFYEITNRWHQREEPLSGNRLVKKNKTRNRYSVVNLI